MKYVDYYAALGLPRDADLVQIKKAYRTLARQHHPDVSKAPGAEDKFKNVAAAYATLKNPEKRAAYDALGLQREGAEMAPHMQGAANGRNDAENRHGPWNFEGMDLSDFLDAMGQEHPHRSPRRGRDMEDTILVTLGDVLHGTTLHLSLQETDSTRDLEVKLPAGMRVGQTLRLRGKGGKGLYGAPDGDFLLHIAYAPHATYQVSGVDLQFNLAISPWEAALGAEVTVPTLDAEVVLRVRAGSSSGKKLRLRGRGLPSGATPDATRGDLYALIQIKVPEVLTNEERSLMEQLAMLSTFTPRTQLPGANHAKTTT